MRSFAIIIFFFVGSALAAVTGTEACTADGTGTCDRENHCSSGGECPSKSDPQYVVSLLQTKLGMNVSELGGLDPEPLPSSLLWRADGRCGPSWKLASGEPAQCQSTGQSPCCHTKRGRCGHTPSDCSCGKLCEDYTVTRDKKTKQHHIGRGCDSELPAGKTKDRAAVLSSGGWRVFTRALKFLPFDVRTKAVLKKMDLNTVFQSHEERVLEPLRKITDTLAHYFLCVDKLGKTMPEFVTEAWSYDQSSQINRIQACLKRVMLREEACADIEGSNYTIFVRIRPDFFVLSDLPDPRTALSNDCVMTRFRSAWNIGGLSNEHLSWCLCGTQCCKKDMLNPHDGSDTPSFDTPSDTPSSDTPSFVVDDMVAVTPRKYANSLWIDKYGPYPLPCTWPPLAHLNEWRLTRVWITQGIKVCPLPFRGLPLGSPFWASAAVSESTQCGYASLGKKLAQTQCGTPHATAESVQNLTPGVFVATE